MRPYLFFDVIRGAVGQIRYRYRKDLLAAEEDIECSAPGGDSAYLGINIFTGTGQARDLKEFVVESEGRRGACFYIVTLLERFLDFIGRGIMHIEQHDEDNRDDEHMEQYALPELE